MAFRVLIAGGTGQVGTAVVGALAAEPFCAEVVMVNRRAIPLTADPGLRQVSCDTAATHFSAGLPTLAQHMVVQGAPVYGASCVGVDKGQSAVERERTKGSRNRGGRWLCHAGRITRFALLSAVGSTSKSRIRYVRVMA